MSSTQFNFALTQFNSIQFTKNSIRWWVEFCISKLNSTQFISESIDHVDRVVRLTWSIRSFLCQVVDSIVRINFSLLDIIRILWKFQCWFLLNRNNNLSRFFFNKSFKIIKCIIQIRTNISMRLNSKFDF